MSKVKVIKDNTLDQMAIKRPLTLSAVLLLNASIAGV